MSSQLRSKIISTFKIHGLSLRSEASKLLLQVLSEVDKDEVTDWLKKLIDVIEKQSLKSTFIDADAVESAVNECNQENDKDDKIFNIIDIFKIPRFKYDNERKKFLLNTSYSSSLFGSPDDKYNLFAERFAIVHQRAMHHELFTPAPIASSGGLKSAKFTLKPIEHLLGSSNTLEEIIILGMLTPLKEGKYFLEDPSGTIELDLSKATFHAGLFTENCFVLAEGKYKDEIFYVTAFGFPPPETSKSTRNFFGNLNFFGGPSTTCVAASQKLKVLEQDENNQNNMFVFLSDLWLDNPKVIGKFKMLLSGYAQQPPALFVICGNFLSKPYGKDQRKVLRKKFNEFCDVCASFPSIVQSSRFIFVPGPQDPGPGNILPRPPLPKVIVQEVEEKIPFAEFVSNPCRIQYCSQEIVIFREDIVNKMCRNSLHLPEDLQNLPNYFVKTILSQAHLCPLPLNVRPIYWCHDNALRLYPLPDLIVCADKFDSYDVTNSDVICMNPGSFPKSEFCFKVYWPANREVEDCKLN